MYNENMNWFSQTLMTHNDKVFNTDGYLRVSYSTGTKDFVNFNPLQLGITISNNQSKNCNLNIQNASELLFSFTQVLQDSNKIYKENDFQIVKVYYKLEFMFEFLTIPESNERVVRMTLRSNESDFAKIIITFDMFVVFARRVKSFVDNYEQFCISILNNFMQKEILATNRGIISSLNTLPSKITPGGFIVEDTIKRVDNSEIQKAESTTQELDKFLDNTDIKISEIQDVENKKEILQEFDSKLLKCFDNNLSNFENMLTTSESSPEPINFIINKLSKDKILMNGVSDFELLPGISEDDMKSLLYISKLNCNITLKNCIEYNKPIPSSVPVLKYEPNVDVHTNNREIAFDLLLFNGYFRCVRRKLENKVDDPMVNKSITYLLLRCYTDVFVFSFLDKHLQIKTNIVSRFKYYDSIGVFDAYKNLLETYNCPVITDGDISFFADEVIEKVIGKTPPVNEFHNKLYESNNVRVGTPNTLNKEQIINELVPLEIAEKMGFEVNFDGISKEVIEAFKKVKKSKTVKKEKEDKESNLYRLVNQFRNEIPESKRDGFLNLIKGLGNNSFVNTTSEFPLEELGENIVKALYLWKTDDQKITTNFKYFFEKFENEMMTKELIIAGSKVEESKSSEGWDFTLNM